MVPGQTLDLLLSPKSLSVRLRSRPGISCGPVLPRSPRGPQPGGSEAQGSMQHGNSESSEHLRREKFASLGGWGQGKSCVKAGGAVAARAGSRKQEAGSRKQEAGSRKQGAGSRKPLGQSLEQRVSTHQGSVGGERRLQTLNQGGPWKDPFVLAQPRFFPLWSQG